MSTVLAHSSTGAGAKTGPAPRLCAATTIRYYRRSTTNKAPRKRSFLVLMTKNNEARTPSVGVASALANNAAMLTYGFCDNKYAENYLDDSGNNGNNNNNNNNNNNGGGNSNGNNNNGDFGDFAARLPRFFSHAFLGALALFTMVAAFPAQSRATASSVVSSLGSSASTSTRRPRSKVMHVSCKGSTMVVPLPASGDAKSSSNVAGVGMWQRKKVVDAPIELSGREVAIIASPQFRVRECMLI